MHFIPVLVLWFTRVLQGETPDHLHLLLDAQLARVSDLQCHQTVHRYVMKREHARLLDQLDFDIELHSGTETYRTIRRNNISYKRLEDLPGSWASGELATVLRVTRAAVKNMPALRFDESEKNATFVVPAAKQQWYLLSNGARYWMSIAGTIQLEGTKIGSIEWRGEGLPEASGIQAIYMKIDFADVNIAGMIFRVPIGSSYSVTYRDGLGRTTVDRSRFSDYRRFGAQASVKFN